ncbi:uncharacterized protein LOC127710759 [Mytilus californianus]|uniref:uncharacterized protein LOC127710759 n=1 Tax=Mytilus californianus TaxID=6549 RepID=UPI0022457781|nr:uncharacterized protein LOC127710759 [Mytilus californianus]
MVRMDVQMGVKLCPDTDGAFVSIGYTSQPNCQCPYIWSVEIKSTSKSSPSILQNTPNVTVPTSTYQSTDQTLDTDLAYSSFSSSLKMRAIVVVICVLQVVILG